MKKLILIVTGVLFLLPFNGEAQKSKKKKPNIIFIMSDDHAYQAISAYDDKLLSTPNIDRLAKEGMLFTNASVTNSICAPSRATILTGKHTHINGKVDNYFPFDTTQVTFPQIFKKNGYKTAMFGKLHFGNNPKGVDEFMILPGQGHYINPDFIVTNGDTISKQGYVTDIITDVSLDWLKKEAADDEPFMMMYLHKAPHRPWWPRPDKFKEFTQKTFPEPETLFDDYSNRGSAAKTAEMNLLTHMMYSHDSKIRPETLAKMEGKVFPVVEEFPNSFYGPYNRATAEQKALYDPVLDSINDFFYNNWPKMNDTEKMKWKYQRYMQDYLGSISSVDDNVGRLLDYLDESGLAENTIVIYTSDQGFYLGEHGWFDKRFIYDESFKTPLLVRWPNVVKPGSVENEMVQNLDFAQTMLEAVGITPPNDMQGESLIPLLKGEKDNWTRDAVYYQYYEYPSVHMVKRHYGIVNKEFKLAHFYYDVDEWELYDRLKDPNEMNNVYNDPAYADTVKKLKKDLVEMRKYYKDSPEQDQKYIKKYKSAGMID
ncbi:sulfatase family protein [Maribacter hydrothermalis]|uniref:Sulfatase n=1 Tax=Maribacter hydrothermalis TaxID=1836467 RepID=A0A1B7ZE28_9FLAO|nr:sulfatase [Maribacter hydrothermalis]APQ16630.1 sulfatase [Maribacter hydrothermalis]OBR41464.1 sulfatase [Maribacter hydrothermalis]